LRVPALSRWMHPHRARYVSNGQGRQLPHTVPALQRWHRPSIGRGNVTYAHRIAGNATQTQSINIGAVGTSISPASSGTLDRNDEARKAEDEVRPLSIVLSSNRDSLGETARRLVGCKTADPATPDPITGLRGWRCPSRLARRERGNEGNDGRDGLVKDNVRPTRTRSEQPK